MEGLYLLDFLENRIIEIDSPYLVRSFLLSQYKPAITISTSTYNDLINSGNVKVFENLKFKKQLYEYYKLDTWSLNIDDRITQTIWYDYRDKITEFIDSTIFKSMYSVGLSSFEAEKIDLLVYEIDWNTLRKSPELLKQLRNVLAFRIVIREDILTHIERAENLLRRVIVERN